MKWKRSRSRTCAKADGTVTALDGIDLSVSQGEIYGILGQNGAGKTTTVEVIEGLTKPDSGSVRVLGLDPVRQRAEVRQVLGAQLQQSRLPEKLRVHEALKLYASFYRNPVPIGELMERVGLTEKRKASFESLSGGQQQRLSIALALVGRPKVAILDEVTTGLDPSARRSMWQMIFDLREGGVTLVLVTHFMEEADRLCDRVSLMRDGRVVALGSPAEIVEGTVGGQQVSLTIAEALPEAALRGVSEVNAVKIHGGEVTVSGGGDLVTAVTGALHGMGVSYTNVRVHQPTLDDAFLKITGAAPGDDRGEAR